MNQFITKIVPGLATLLLLGMSSWNVVFPVYAGTHSSGNENQAQAQDSRPPSESASDETVRLLPLHSADFEAVKPAIEPLLSESGSMVHIPFRNAVLIYDQHQNIRVIEKVLEQIPPPANIRITVTFEETARERESRLGAESGHIVISHPENGDTEIRGEVRIRGAKRTRKTTRETTQFVMTRNNHPARIWVGKHVARPVWVYKYGLRHGWWHPDVEYRDIGASLWVHPRLTTEGRIRVEVFPKLTLVGQNRLSVEARKLSTQVVVNDGGTVRIGGFDDEERRFYKRLFGVGNVFGGRRLTIRLRADIIRPDDESIP